MIKNNPYRNSPGTKNPLRQYQGAVNKAAGQNFEQIIDESLSYYEQHGIAIIEKTPEPMRPCKDLGNGKFIAYYEKQAQPDYKGALNTGRAVVFEAKHTTSDSIKQSRVTDDQSKALDKYAKMGAECFVVVGFDMRLFFRVPWAVFRDMKTRWGRKYATPSDLEEYAISTGRLGQLLILNADENCRRY